MLWNHSLFSYRSSHPCLIAFFVLRFHQLFIPHWIFNFCYHGSQGFFYFLHGPLFLDCPICLSLCFLLILAFLSLSKLWCSCSPSWVVHSHERGLVVWTGSLSLWAGLLPDGVTLQNLNVTLEKSVVLFSSASWLSQRGAPSFLTEVSVLGRHSRRGHLSCPPLRSQNPLCLVQPLQLSSLDMGSCLAEMIEREMWAGCCSIKKRRCSPASCSPLTPYSSLEKDLVPRFLNLWSCMFPVEPSP